MPTFVGGFTMSETRTVRLSEDAYNVVKDLKNEIRRIGNTYSMSDVITVSAFVLNTLLKTAPDTVKSMLDTARLLRLKKHRGEFKGSIFDALISEHADKLKNSRGYQREMVEEIIRRLIDDKHLDAAADLLFNYRDLIGEEKFKDFSAEILMMKMKKEKSGLDG